MNIKNFDLKKSRMSCRICHSPRTKRVDNRLLSPVLYLNLNTNNLIMIIDTVSLAAPAEGEDLLEIPKFNIGTFNAISPSGLRAFPSQRYSIMPMQSDEEIDDPHAIMLRSFKLGSDHVPRTVRAVARCGAGTNNIDVAALTAR